MSTRCSDVALKSVFVAVMLFLCSIAISLQLLYAIGQVYHFAVMAYKGGGAVPHMISFGRSGVVIYLVVAIVMACGLWAFIRHRGGVRKAKAAALLLVSSLLSTALFVGLLITPYSDVVSR